MYKTVLIFLFSLPCICGRAQSSGTAVSSDGTPVFYRTYGSGKPLLIINGGPGMNSDGFENLAIQLSENNMTIIYDQRGTGKSPLKVSDKSTVTIKLMMDDIESLRKQLHIERWSVLGHSFGGMLASEYAALYANRIDKLILSSSGGIDLDLLGYVSKTINAKLTKAALDSVHYWEQRISNGDTGHAARLGRGRNLAPAYVLDKKFIPVIAERLTQGNQQVNGLIWSDLQRIHFNCAGKLKSFDRPVLIIQGKNDIVSAQTAEKAHAVLKNSKLVFLAHSIHYGWLDNKEMFFAAVRSFLAGS